MKNKIFIAAMILFSLLYPAYADINSDIAMYFNSGKEKLANDDYYGAAEDFTRCIYLKPNDYLLFNYRANAYEKMENYEAAAVDYSYVIKVTKNKISEQSKAYFKRANSYLKLKKYKLAVEDFKKTKSLYLRLGKNNSSDFKHVNHLISKIESEHLKYYNAQNISKAKEYKNLAKTAVKSKDYKKAKDYMSLAIELLPEQASYYKLLAQIQILDNDVFGAVPNLEKAAALYQKQGETEEYQKVSKILGRIK